MPFSDLGFAVDDSFDVGPARRSHRQLQGGPGYTHQGPRSGHWTVSNGTTLGSGIDDCVDTVHPGGPRGAGGGFAPEQPIPGSVLGRFARANAAEREKEKQRMRLEAVEEEAEDEQRIDSQSKVGGRGSKFYVPKLDGMSILIFLSLQ